MDSVLDEFLLEPEESGISQDRRAELTLGALVCGLIGLLLAITIFIVVNGWPSFAHNGISWFLPGGDPNAQIAAMNNPAYGKAGPWTFNAWNLIWSSIIITVGSVVVSFVCSLFVSIFLVEFAPEPLKRVLEPVVRVLASVPSVVYGLVGVMVLVPFIGNHISGATKRSVTPLIQLDGSSLLAAIVILSVMIAPIMISLFSEGLRSVPRNWLEGSIALGVNRWRSFWNIAVRTARPALIAGTVLATARGIGEAVMLGMVSGSVSWAPNPLDGLFLFWLEPSQPLPATIFNNPDDFTQPHVRATLFAIAAVLLFSALMLSLAGWAAKQPMKRYFNVGGAAA